MKNIFTFFAIIIFQTTFSQTIINSKTHGTLEFKELDYGLAKIKKKTNVEQSNSPTGTRGWLEDFEIIDKTDSIKGLLHSNFGVIYIVNAKDTMNVDVVIEWIYPQKITNNKGERFKSIKYTTQRPTNIPSASSYSLDEPYEIIKGEWKMNIYIENKRVCSKTFILY